MKVREARSPGCLKRVGLVAAADEDRRAVLMPLLFSALTCDLSGPPKAGPLEGMVRALWKRADGPHGFALHARSIRRDAPADDCQRALVFGAPAPIAWPDYSLGAQRPTDPDYSNRAERESEPG